jgi:MFS family permease
MGTFSAIFTDLEEYYNLTPSEINLFTTLLLVAYPIGSIPAQYIIDNKSMKLAVSIFIKIKMVLASCLSFFPAILKYFMTINLSFAYIGQVLFGFSQALIYNSTAKIAAIWFKENIVFICILNSEYSLHAF